MKKTFKKVMVKLLIFLLIVGCMPTDVKALGGTVYGADTDWSYIVEDGYAVIWRYNGSSQDVVIPSKVGAYTVKGLSYYILPYSTHVLNVTIPSTVEKIDSLAFSSGTDSDHHLLYGSLQNVYVDESNPYFSSQDGILYNKDKTKLVKAPEGREFGKYAIPSNVTEIGNCAFECCNGLTELVISNSVKKLGNYSFMDCENLVYVKIEEGLESMGSNALGYCDKLKRIDLPSTLKRLDQNFPFVGNDELEQINVESNNPFFTSKDGVMFNKSMTELLLYPSNKHDKSYIVPSTVEKITRFERNKNISSIFLPNGLKEISYMEDLESLTSLILPETLKKLGTRALAYNNNLKEITIPVSVTFIGEFALYGCNSLKTVTILNKDCEILESKDTISDSAKIKGYSASTAYNYAYCYGRTFVDIETLEEKEMTRSITDLLNFLPKDKIYFGEPAYGSIYYTNSDGVILKYMPSIIHESNREKTEYVELKNFTYDLVKDCSTDMEKVKTISNWVYNNLEYSLGSVSGNSIESVYNIFKRKYGNCMCYAQLTNYMLYLEGIPTVILVTTGHECGAALVDNEWILVDSTGNFVGNEYINFYDDFYDVERIMWADGVLTYEVRNLSGVKVASIGYDQTNEKEVKEITIPNFVNDLYPGIFNNTADDLIVHGLSGGKVEETVKKNFEDISYDGKMFTAKHKKDSNEDSREDSNVNPKKDSNTSPEKDSVKIGTVVTVNNIKYKVTSFCSIGGGTVEIIGYTHKLKNAVKIPTTIKINGNTYSVVSIIDKAFKNNKKITKISITDRIYSIGKYAFQNCEKLKTVNLYSHSTTRIGAYAFKGCRKLTKLNVKSDLFTKKGLRNSLKGSSIKIVKLHKSINYKKISYQKVFAKKNCGKKVTVR